MATYTLPANEHYYVSGFGIVPRYDRTGVRAKSLEVTFTYYGLDGTQYSGTTISEAILEDNIWATVEYADISAWDPDPKMPVTALTVTYTVGTYSFRPMGIVDFVVFGSPSSTYDATKLTLESSINKYAVLFALSEGPIEGLYALKAGDTEIVNDLSTEADTNFEYAIAEGISFSDAQANNETARSDASLVVTPTWNKSSLWGWPKKKKIVGSTAIQQSAELQLNEPIPHPEFKDLFRGTNFQYSLFSKSLDHRTCYNAVDIDLDPVSVDSVGTFDSYPERVTITLDFPGGLCEYDDNGDVASTLFELGIQYYDDVSATFENQADAMNISEGNIYVREGDLGFIDTTDSDNDINYQALSFRVKNNTNLRLHLQLYNIPEEVRRIKIFRRTDDAYIDNGAWADASGYYTGLLDNVGERKISSCDVPKYQLKYEDTKMGYSGTALLGLRAVANSKLSGQFPTILATIAGRKIDYIPRCRPDETLYTETSLSTGQIFLENYETALAEAPITWDEDIYVPLNTSAWKSGYCTNPVWCLLDVLLNKRFGLGNYITEEELDIESFFEAAKFCDVKLENYAVGTSASNYIARYSLNMVLDVKMPAKSLMEAILQTFRGVMFWNDGKYSLKIDKADTVSQILNDTQITNVAYAQKSLLSVPNAVEVKFLNQTEDFEQYTIYLEDATNVNLSGGAIRTQSSLIAGVTHMQQAMSLAKYMMYTAQNIRSTMQFTASLDLLSAEIWDVIKVQTSKFLNDATYASFIKTISSGTPVGTAYSYDLTLSRLPIEFDSGASDYYFAIQSYAAGTITLFEGTALAGSSLDTATYDVTIISDTASLDSLIQEDDKFTIYGNLDSYEEWRIVSISTNPQSNSVTINCINYLDSYYDDLDTYDTPHYFTSTLNKSKLSGELTFDYAGALNNPTVKVTTYVDNLLNAMRANLSINFPDILDEARTKISKIIILGSYRPNDTEEFGDEMVLNVADNPGGAISVQGLVPGLYKLRFRLEDAYGRQYISEIYPLSLELGSIPLDDGQSVSTNTALQTGLLSLSGTNFAPSFVTSTYLELKWLTMPNIITFLSVSYTDTGTTGATDTFLYPIARNSDNEVIVQQSLKEFTTYYKEYEVEVTYTDVYGNTYVTPTPYTLTNPAPVAPSAGMFSVSTDETRVYVDIEATQYNQYLASERDFVGFLLTVDYSLTGGAPWTSATYNYRKGVVDLYDVMNTLGASLLYVRIYVQALDNFDQTSAPVLIGTDTVETSNILSRDDLATEFLGDSISLNLLRNSSFEQGNNE